MKPIEPSRRLRGLRGLRGLRALGALGALVSVAACYTQRPVSTPEPASETRIVAAVTDVGIVEMGNAIGPGAVEVEGVIASADASVWQVRLLRVDHRGGRSAVWNRELVSFPRYALTNPRERRLDRTKSWLVAGLITVSAILAARVYHLVGGDDTGGTDPIPQEHLMGGRGGRP